MSAIRNVMILASAGSGKTYALSNRVIELVAAGVDPERIVALTFTRKAAGEFTDDILRKLAGAAAEARKAERLATEIGAPQADFAEFLDRVVRALPRMTLGTIDSFFQRVVRAFSFELGVVAERLELLEGPRLQAMTGEVLDEVLRHGVTGPERREVLLALKRATAGKESVAVRSLVREFLSQWHAWWFAGIPADGWGCDRVLGGVSPVDWEADRDAAADKALSALDEVDYTDRRQRKALEAVVEAVRAHAVGSGSLNKRNELFGSLVEAVGRGGAKLEVKYQKPFKIGGAARDAIDRLLRGVAMAELQAALDRTAAVRKLVEIYDREVEVRLRRRGLLEFDDIKRLMGAWAHDEDERLRRERIDERLDARFDHWMLDEFQDTSVDQWSGLAPLLDEAMSDDARSVFIVGDKKQAIYGWRGGEYRLFDDVAKRYAGGLEISSLIESWRSCEAVLALVNRVCGGQALIRSLFDAAADDWQWEEHHSASGPEHAPAGLSGEARVEVVPGKLENRCERLVELFVELDVRNREIDCGILLRSNEDVRLVADWLRQNGFDVVEEGARRPAHDNTFGVAVRSLLEWLANPAERFFVQVVEMSPLHWPLCERWGEAWQRRWEGILAHVVDAGFSGLAEELIAPMWERLSDYGRRRTMDIMTALRDFDVSGDGSVAGAARWLRNLEVSQPPGGRAVQVMTIHKSKGLGFDLVVLPNLPSRTVPDRGKFDVADGETDGVRWITDTPPAWARTLLPAMRAAEERWTRAQRYEMLCLEYVALTRAKRGLYVLLGEPGAGATREKASMDNWVRQGCAAPEGHDGVLYQCGDRTWIEEMRARTETPERKAAPLLPKPRTAPARRRPSGHGVPAEKGRATDLAGRRLAMRAGTAAHAAFEAIEWIEDGSPAGAGPECLRGPEVRRLFIQPEGDVEVLREQLFEWIDADGNWVSGVMDRIHVWRTDERVTRVEIIDFKTDRVETSEQLIDRHREQMATYRAAAAAIFGIPERAVRCLLVSTVLARVIEV
jgi:ATP-dependent helicase/nuclease subunit A